MVTATQQREGLIPTHADMGARKIKALTTMENADWLVFHSQWCPHVPS